MTSIHVAPIAAIQAMASLSREALMAPYLLEMAGADQVAGTPAIGIWAEDSEPSPRGLD